MKLVSWNVNGIRAALRKDFTSSIQDLDPDIFCLQETKAQEGQAQMLMPQYKQYWNSAEKKGYSGTAVFTKIDPVRVSYGLDSEENDSEGRVITLEFERFYLLNVYTPNSGRDLSRLSYRQEWDKKFRGYIKKLEKDKPVIICGDLNVAHKEIDIANPQGNKTTKSKPGNAGFTDQEREDFTKHLDSGLIDTFRYLYPNKEKYSWWTYMFNARSKNKGWRLDYFLVTRQLEENIEDAFIYDEIYGSDHCPIGLKIRI
ncbi:MAG: exodeoxyribonuclease III [Nanobdellota archaeon]